MTGRMPAERFATFPVQNLDGQFVLCRSDAHVPPGWPVQERAGWRLAAHASLPVLSLCARDGASVGWMLGWPISGDGVWLEGDVTLAIPADAGDAEFAASLYQLGGKFLAVWLPARGGSVWLDAGGTLSCVFSPAHQLVAATPSLVPYSHGCEDDTDLLARTGLMDGTRNPDGLSFSFAFGTTSRRGVERLLPNHALNLDTWTVRRHWPSAPIAADADPRDVVARVGAIVERNMRAVASRMPVRLPLTAGHDSRALLACARTLLDRIELLTIAFPDGSARMDVTVAEHLARRQKLVHRTLVCGPSNVAQLDEWLWRTGACVGSARGWQAMNAYASLPDSRPEISGALGEAARASYWKDLRAANGMPDANTVVRALALPETPDLVLRARAWLDSLPATRPMHVVDLVLLEQRVGSWSGVVPYGHARALPFRFTPFAHRDAIESMLRLPDEYKLAARFPRDLIASRWPELLAVPFNRYSGFAHYVNRARKHVWRARRALSRSR